MRSQGDVAVVSLNRPGKRNAMTPDMLRELDTALRASADSCRCLVLGGEGPVFCGGFDLRLCHERPGTLAELLQGLHTVMVTLRGLDVPVVAAAHGAAIAGGCALLGGCDIRITNAEAKLGYPVTPLGVSPAISAPFLQLLVGSGHSRARLLDPALVSGPEAVRIGLASECLPAAADVLPRALEAAAALASKPAGSLAATRRWLRGVEDRRGCGSEAALGASLSLVGSAEERERLAALFASGRP
jgi:methylglutaconyl-CoA hydratase